MTDLLCTHCLLADQQREWYPEPDSGEPETDDLRTRYSNPGDPILIYKGESFCLPHFNVARGWPPHGLNGPTADPEEIARWREEQRRDSIERLRSDALSDIRALSRVYRAAPGSYGREYVDLQRSCVEETNRRIVDLGGEPAEVPDEPEGFVTKERAAALDVVGTAERAPWFAFWRR